MNQMGRSSRPLSKCRKRTSKSKAARLRKNQVLAKTVRPGTETFDTEKPGPSSLHSNISSYSPISSLDMTNVEGHENTPSTSVEQGIFDKTCIIEKSPEWSFISNTEYDEVMGHQLCIEVDKSEEVPIISGNRIVDLNYVLKWALPLQTNHSKICTSGKIFLKEESRYGTGLVSSLTFACTMCTKIYKYDTEEPGKKSKINYGLVWGTLSTGSTFSHAKELLCSMDISPMTLYMFKKIEESLGEKWQDSLFKNMEKAGEEEKRIALEKNDIDEDNVPFIKVYLDGGWSKRSYGHSYNAASGVAVIMGYVTKKVLFLGVRNKYCSICARAQNKQILPSEHICYKNWSGSSTAMEADIVVEGFKNSIKMHGIRYKKFIADGDSSVYAKIREQVDYGTSVEKIECTNHALKNYGKALRKIKTDTKINLDARKILSNQKIIELEKHCQNAIYDNAHGDVESLKEDIGAGPHHVFGDHSKCKSYNCPSPNINHTASLEGVKNRGLIFHIEGALDTILKKAHKLIDNETNNRAEIFMAIMARFNAGKRLNLIQRGSFQMRAHLSALRYNEGITWHYSPWKDIFGESPGKEFKKFMDTEKHARDLRDLRRTVTGNKQKHKTVKDTCLPNTDYGPKAEQANLSDIEFQSECSRILKKLQITEEEASDIQKNSIGQFENSLYLQERKYRLTASHFGSVIKRLEHTSCHTLVKQILYGNIQHKAALEFGKCMEPMVRARFAYENNIDVQECGLFIDRERGYLGASPDGILGNYGVIEIKCFYKAAKENIGLEEAIKKYKTCLKLGPDNKIMLNQKHNYYYQIQGQLNITGRNVCYFVIYSGENNPLYVEEIRKDEGLWKKSMVPKLEQFYKNCMLPEIIHKNIPQGKRCVDPPYIVKAQMNKKK